MDATLDLTLMVLSGVLTFLYARWLDPIFQAKMRRRFSKQNWGLMNILNPDGRTIITRVVNFTKGIVPVGDNIWILENDRVWLNGNKDLSFSLKKDSKDTKLVDGVPCVFADMNSVRFIKFYEGGGGARPDEAGALILMYIMTEIKKKVMQFELSGKWIKFGTVAAIGAFLIGLYIASQIGGISAAANACAAGVKTLGAGAVTPDGVTQVIG